MDSHAKTAVDWESQCLMYKERYEKCFVELEEVKQMNKRVSQKLDILIAKLEKGKAVAGGDQDRSVVPGAATAEPIYQFPTSNIGSPSVLKTTLSSASAFDKSEVLDRGRNLKRVRFATP